MIENVYPLSHLQEDFYYHWLSSPDSPAYFLQMSYRLKGDLDINLLQRSYQALVERHAALRTFFTQDFGEQVLQVVRRDANPVFIYKEITGDTEAAVKEYKAADRAKGFNLQTGSQMRLSVLALGNDTYEFIWSHHHIIMDGWCVGILMKEFFQVYSSLADGRISQLPKAYQYASYIEWLTKSDKERSVQYWNQELSGFDNTTGLPKRTTPAGADHLARQSGLRLGSNIRQAVKDLCAQNGVTEYTFFQAVWALLLSRYNNTNDVVFGAVVSGRPAEVKGIEEMIGLFINTIPVRVQLQEGTNIINLLKEVQQRSIEGMDHHYTQLAEIYAQTGLGQKLFDHIIQYQNFPVPELGSNSDGAAQQSKGLSLLSSAIAGHNTYDFTCLIGPGEELEFEFMYNGNKYDEWHIAQLQSHLSKLISEIIADPAQPVGQIDFLSAAEKQQLLVYFNAKVKESFKNKTLTSLFEQQAASTPDSIAVVFEGRALTYRQLNEKANQLANHFVLNYNVQPDEPIGVMTERSENLVIAILAIFKAGAVYVPVDPEYPDQRKQHILSDAGVKVLVTKSGYMFNMSYYSGSFFAMDIQLDALDTAVASPGILRQPNDLAYIIYTSGSTGQPKGVMIAHTAAANTIQAHRAIFDLTEGDRSLQFASSSFDASVTQIFVPLISGGALYIIDENEKKDPALLEQYITVNRIDFADIPPAYQKLMNMENISTLKKLGSGGEAAIPSKVNEFTKYGTYFNAYGPTEAAICATMFVAPKGESFTEAIVPIGKPIQNVRIYILDSNRNLMPAGTVGEIYIGGDGLAKGYLNNPELTATKFVEDPFRPGEEIYRTGDLGRWLPDGNIEFAGRKDDQVKIRGYRIELGEIENALRTHPAIHDAVVIARPDHKGEKELTAYLERTETLDETEVADYLGRLLPEYMLPVHYVQLDALPVTTNGKIDKKNLPDPGNGMRSAAQYVAPRNETEEKLVEIWEEILGREKIGVKDDFFKLGGHSIKVVQLISRINASFLVRIDIQSIFNDPTIESISEQILFILEQNRQKENVADLVQIEI